MGIRHVGYPCIRINGERQTVKTCQLKNAKPDRLKQLIDRNLKTLSDVLSYNITNNISFFRIHSDTIPFASHSDVDFNWLEFASDKLSELGTQIKSNDLRISMHPGQYTVLNSLTDDVVANARQNLRYHTEFLNALNLKSTAKIVLHVGGVYGDKSSSMDRFVNRANDLDSDIRDRLVIENDENCYDISEIFELSTKTGLPVLFDWLHHNLNKPGSQKTISDWLEQSFQTWDTADGAPIVHFSSARDDGNGHHADQINPDAFHQFSENTQHLRNFDVMLECKDKEIALLNLRESVSS